MDRVITLTDDSAKEASQRLSAPTMLPYNFSFSSRLIHRQIKHQMQMLLHEMTREVLEGLEKELRTRVRASWPTAFCVILVLCLCIEMVQVATDGFVVHTQRHEGGDSVLLRETGIEICRSLDGRPYNGWANLFHAVHRSHKKQRGFNPIRDGLGVDEKEGLDQAALNLVNEIHQITENGKYLFNLVSS